MARVTMRFYGALNDFLAPPCRGRPFAHDSARHASVKHAVEALGVPHTEVDLVLVDGDSVAFDHPLHDGEQVSVYPPFAALDPGTLSKVRPPPVDEPRFVADAHLGRLARYLRFLGFDTLQRNAWNDGELVALARDTQRIVLTRDRALLMRRDVVHGACLRADDPLAQLREVGARYGLARRRDRPARCLRCNAVLEAVDKAAVAARLPPAVQARHDAIWHCAACDQLFWRGSHWQRLRHRVDAALRGLEPPPALHAEG